jgi:hypothetical protein
LPSTEIRGIEQMGKATWFSAFKESAMDGATAVDGGKCHWSPEALKTSGKKTVPSPRLQPTKPLAGGIKH